MLDFLTVQTTSADATLISIIYSVLLAFLLSTLIAITYEKTFCGMSYSRSFIHTIILSSIVSATIMQAIGDNFARGLGMMGAFAIVRFRTVFKDSRDTIFLFASLASGLACGVFGYKMAIVGTFIFCMLAFVLRYTTFGTARYFDGMLRFNIDAASTEHNLLEQVLKEHCKKFALITLKEIAQGERIDYAYHVKLRSSEKSSEFILRLKSITTVKNVQLLLQETTVEL